MASSSTRDDGPAIGIVLGTAYSCVAVWRYDCSDVITNDLGKHLTPSCVAFTATGSLVGEAAVNQAPRNPTNTIFGEYDWPVFLPYICRRLSPSAVLPSLAVRRFFLFLVVSGGFWTGFRSGVFFVPHINALVFFSNQKRRQKCSTRQNLS